MSILSSTDSGRRQKLTKDYLFEECHLMLFNYSGMATDKIGSEIGIWAIYSTMHNRPQFIQLYNGLFTFHITINGLSCNKILKTKYDADLVVNYWKALIEYNDREMTKAMKEIIQLSDLW
jgi:hypothetical protein